MSEYTTIMAMSPSEAYQAGLAEGRRRAQPERLERIATALDWREIEGSMPDTIKDCADILGIESKDYVGSRDWKRVAAVLRIQHARALIAELDKEHTDA